ncbi:hypothetical protein [Mycobacterium shinjukuense]
MRDERVLHSDTGPGEPDRSREEALETILYDHYPGAKRRRKTLPRANP